MVHGAEPMAVCDASADQSQSLINKLDSVSEVSIRSTSKGSTREWDDSSVKNPVSAIHELQNSSSPNATAKDSQVTDQDKEKQRDIITVSVTRIAQSPTASTSALDRPQQQLHEDDTVALQLKYPGRLVVKVAYHDAGPLYVDLYSRVDGNGAFVKGFRRKPDGSMAHAEAHGSIHVDDMLYSINELVVTDLQFSTIIESARKATFPLTLTFICAKYYPEAEKLRRESAGSIPSPRVSMTKWSSKLNQMIDNGVRSRSPSTDRKSSHENLAMALESPGMSGAAKFRQWQESNLERMRSSDGVKQLFRMIGRKNPEEDRETIAAILANLELVRDEDSESSSISLVSNAPGHQANARLLENEFVMAWYRRTSNDDLMLIKGAVSSKYTPCADDIDSRISCQCQSVRFPHLSKLLETSQLQIDPTIRDTVNVLVEAGAGSFSATLATSELDSFQIRINRDNVTLVKVSEEEDDCGVVASAEYDQHVQVLLDPSDPLRFCLKFREFGGVLGVRPGETCDLRDHKQKLAQTTSSSSSPSTSEAMLSTLSCVVLLTPSREHRDIVALLIRHFRREKVTEDQSKEAIMEEQSLFIDPSSNLDIFHTNVVLEAATGSSYGIGTPPNGQSGAWRTGSVQPASTGLIASASSSTLPPPLSISARVPSPTNDEACPTMKSHEEKTLKEHLGDLVDEQVTEDDENTPAETDVPSSFLQERVNAQVKENSMLRQKITSLSVLLKVVENEKVELRRAMEIKEERIIKQQVQLQQMELALNESNAQLELQFIELEALQSRVEEEIREKELWLTQHEEDKVMEEKERLELIRRREDAQQDQERVKQLELQVLQLQLQQEQQQCQQQKQNNESSMAQQGCEEDDKIIDRLRRQVEEQQKQLDRFQRENHQVLAERNAFENKATSLSIELGKLLKLSGSMEELSRQLLERKRLAMELSITRAEAKRSVDEMNEYKDALQCMMKQTGMGDKETHRVLSQNLELQRTVNEMTDQLNESHLQITTLKSINSALAQQMQCAAVELSSPMSSSSSVMSRLEDFDDDDEEDDGDEGDVR